MATKIKLLLLILIALVGCKTTKEITETRSRVSETILNDLKVSIDSTSTVKASASILETVLENDSFVVVETVVELSAPDSSGKQHPEKITTRKAVSGRQTQKQTTVERDTISTAEVNKTITDKSRDQTDADADTKVKSKKDSRAIGLAIALSVGLLAGLLIIAYVERDSLRKWFSDVIGWAKKTIGI